VWKISPPRGFDLRTVQPVASRYTDYSNPAHYRKVDSWRVISKHAVLRPPNIAVECLAFLFRVTKILFQIGYPDWGHLRSSVITSPVTPWSPRLCHSLEDWDILFPFPTRFTWILGPKEPPVQWIPSVPFVGVKRPGLEADHSLQPHAVPYSFHCAYRDSFTFRILTHDDIYSAKLKALFSERITGMKNPDQEMPFVGRLVRGLYTQVIGSSYAHTDVNLNIRWGDLRHWTLCASVHKNALFAIFV
jgi:hypothetical protein